MRRLSFLLLSLLLIYAGVHVVTGAESYASFLIRDGLLFWLAGGVVFALNAYGWRAPQPARRVVTIVETGETLLLTGAVMAIAGATLMGWAAPGILDLMGRFVWIIGLILLIVGAWWPGGRVEYAPPAYRWVKDAGGKMVRMATDAKTVEAGPLAGGRTVFVSLIVIVAVAAGLRFWNLASLPPGCVANECINGLRLVEGQPLLGTDSGQIGLYEQLARLFLTITNNSILSLRLSAAIFGLSAVVIMFALARRLTSPVIALFATALLALSPWHLWAGRSSDPWIATTLYAALALWLALRALAWGNARWWVLAGLASALLFVETPILRDVVFFWLLILIGLGLWSAWHSTQRRAGLAAVGAGAATAWACMIPALMAGGTTQLWAVLLPDGVGSWIGNAGVLLGALLRPDAIAGPFAGTGLISGVIVMLIIAGIAALVRNLRALAAVSVLAGILLLALGAAHVGFTTQQPASLLLPLLPFLLGAATVAIDRFVTALVLAWGPPMIRPVQLVATVAAILLVLIAPRTWGLLGELDAAGATGENQIETDAARYIAAQVQANPDSQTTYVAPPYVLAHPSVRLLAGAALAAGRVLPLELAKTLPYSGDAPGDVVYLAPVLETQLIDVLRDLYPRGVAGSELNEAGDRTLFNTFRVPQADAAAAQGLTLNLFQGADFGGGELATEPSTAASLDYAWGTEPPMPGQFSALWSGSLVVPESGRYTFSVENGAPDAQFNLKLDDLLMLDTSLGLLQQEVPLAQGLYRIDMTYRSGATPGDLRVRWQTPGGAPEIMQGAALHTPMLPDRGLTAEYYPNALFQGPSTENRKEPIIGLGATPELPYSVKWQGKLAAPRSGEYLLSTAAQGLSQVLIDNQIVVDNSVALAMKEDAGYAEGLIYLPKGWHTIEARYAPNGDQPSYRLLWQPAGSAASELTGQYLRPTLGDMATIDVPLPPAPPLISPILGDDQFALSQPSAVWQPRIRIPPSDLPPMPLESLWVTSNGCGAAENQLSAPHGVAFSPDGSQIYVADTGNRRVVVYDIDGGVREVITSDLFQEPVDVAFEPDGTLAVLDALGSPILRRVNGQMEPLPIQTGFYRPRGFTIDRSGNYFVADTGGGRVAVIGVDGASLGDFGGPDSMLGKGQPVDAMVDENRVWVISAEDGRLWNMAGEGSFTAIQPTNTIDGPQLARLSDGRVLLTDPGRSTFGLYAVSGEPQAQFGYSGQFATPTGIASTLLGGADVIAVTDTRQCTLSMWRLAK